MSTERDVQNAMRDRMKARYELMASTTATTQPIGRTVTITTPSSEEQRRELQQQMQQAMYPQSHLLVNGLPVMPIHPQPMLYPQQPAPPQGPQYFQDPFLTSRPPSAVPPGVMNASVAGALPPPLPTRTAPNTSIVNYDRCRSLKERIHDRLGRRSPSPAGIPRPPIVRQAPTRYTHTPPVEEEPTKDVYYHERPFPVTSVLEVERMTGLPLRGLDENVVGHNRDNSSKEVLLMASECAGIVNDLKHRLGVVEADNADLRDQLDGKTAHLTTAEEKIAALSRQLESEATRCESLTTDLERTKAACRADIERERGMGESSRSLALQDLEAEHTNALNNLRRALDQSNRAVDELQGDKRRLEELNAELRSQLSNNARSVETNSDAVDRLTKELVLAKQQTSFISVGYKRQEAELTRLNAITQRDASELERLRSLESAHMALVADHSSLRAHFESQQPDVAAAPQLRDEVASLRERSNRLEATLVTRDERIQELKELVDQIRSQASAAYQHARGFNNEAASHNPAGLVSDPPYRRGAGNDELNLLMDEVHREERRADEERQRWRDRMDAR